MKKIILQILFISCVLNGVAQTNPGNAPAEPCYFDTYVRQHKNLANEFEKTIQGFLSQQKKISLKSVQSTSVKTIPVVVHVIHNGGTENISDAQIQSQIDVLNEDFRKKAGTNGDGNGVDTEIEFCLAKLTPDGKCTNGIVRIQSTLTNHQTYQRALLKQLSYWDNTRYLNVYVVKNINSGSGSGIAGYSSFPGGPPDEDGIVVRHDYFGRMGTAIASSNGRTTTHEISHWFGLYHVFNGGCGADTCTDGDYVCDTPPAASPNYGCPTINSCSIDFPNVNDQVQNYADYSDDACKSMFTAGQKTRMDATLNTFRTVIWSAANITATGCDSGFVNGPCNVIADFTANSQNICVGNQVLFTNKSLNSPTSFQWYFTGGTPATSTVLNPTVTYSSLGTYPVKLVAYGSLGSDSVETLSYISVTTPPVGQVLPFFEDFETSVFPPNGITIDNPDGGITWERDTVAIEYAGIGAAKINNLINTNYGQSDAMILPRFDFTTFIGTPYLNFKWAYAKSDPSYSDELIVLVSSDCGVNWTQKFYRTGATMTTGPTQTTPYVPDTNTVWKTANVNLNTYAASNNVLIKIVNVTDGGNNLYIDNINLGGNVTAINENELKENTVWIYPNPLHDFATIQISDKRFTSYQFKIYNIFGSELISETISNSEKFTINRGDLAAGIYFIRVRSGNYFITKKLIIQ